MSSDMGERQDSQAGGGKGGGEGAERNQPRGKWNNMVIKYMQITPSERLLDSRDEF